MAEDGPKLKAMREMGQPELARRFATADGKPQRTQPRNPGPSPAPAEPADRVAHVGHPKPKLMPVRAKAKEPVGDGVALRSTAHPTKPFKKRFRRKLQTKALETVEIEVPAVPYAKAVRLLTGLTQAEFAAAHGFSRRTFEGWERGASEPNAKARAKLAEIETKAKDDSK